MSLLNALFGGRGGMMQMPEMAGNQTFGQRLLSGSPINSLINGAFPKAPIAPDGTRSRSPGDKMANAMSFAQMAQPQAQPAQFAPMQGGSGPDLASYILQFMRGQGNGQ